MANAMIELDSYAQSFQFDNQVEPNVDLLVKETAHEEKKEEDIAPMDYGGTENAMRIQPNMSTVEYEQPRPKRQKVEEVVTAKELIAGISTSMTREERLNSLWKAKTAFDHRIEAVHDHEISERVDVALVKELAFVMCKATVGPGGIKQLAEPFMEDVVRVCEILEMVYGASSTSVGESFNRVGNDLVELLVSILNMEISLRAPPPGATTENNTSSTQEGLINHMDRSGQMVKKLEEGQGKRLVASLSVPPRSPQGDILLIKTVKILCHFARVGNVTKELAFSPGLISSVLSLINLQPYVSIPWEARLSALWTLANLACNPENMRMMVCTPGLVRTLVTIGSRSLDPHEPMEVTMEVLRSRSISARACFNLSWAPENKVVLSENYSLVDMLAQLSILRKTPTLKESQTVKEILLQTRRHAVGAIRNLAIAPRRHKIRLCKYNKGNLLNVLTDTALNEPDQAISDRAFAAIHSLAVYDTAEMMVERPALVLALKSALVPDGSIASVKTNKKESTKKYASGTLKVLERSITSDMSCYETLRDLLEAVNPTVTSDEETEAKAIVTCAI